MEKTLRIVKVLSKLDIFRVHIQIGELEHLDTFQDFLIAENMKPRMHILEISISSLKLVIVRPTKTSKSADRKCQFLTFKVNFLCQKLSESF